MEQVRHKGVVKWFNHVKGFGFIASQTALPGGKDVFVHYLSIEMRGYRSLKEGDEVEFFIEEGAKGWQAASCRLVQCPHDRLNEDGICRQCGADKRGG